MAEPTTPSHVRRVRPEALLAFCLDALRIAGVNDEDARLTADILVTTDTWGVHTHGTRQLRQLLKNVGDGRLSATARDEIAAQGPAWAIVDAHYAMPPAVAHRAMALAIQKAKAVGIAYVGVKHSSHYGAAGYYAVQAAWADMVGISTCNVDPGVAAPGGRGKVLGTNPIAYAAPAGKERPVFLDIATSAVAATKVFTAKNMGQPIPDNWLVDDDGLPTSDPSEYPQKGALLPMAGHKGYGLAFFVEVLSGVLPGAGMMSQIASWVADTRQPTNEGHGFIAIDVGQMMPLEEFKARMDWAIGQIKATPPAKGSKRVYLPGEMEWERRDAALAQGMALPEEVARSLAGLAQDVGLDFERLYC